jgi:hypothetical protein
MTSTASLLETLVELEHRQWQHWSQATAAQVPESLRARWQDSWRPYAELSEEAKEMDRAWARLVLERLREHQLIPPT